MTAPTTQAEQEDAVRRYTWIGDDCPEGWRRVGSIDVADPADIVTARSKGRRIGEIYHGGSYSVAEPCCADTYARTPLGERADELEWKVGDLQEDLKFAEAQRDQLAADLRKAREERDAHFMSLAAATCELMRGAHSGGAEIQALRKVCLLQARELKRLDPDGDTPVDLNAAMEKLRAALTPDPTDAGGTAKGDDHG